MHILNFKSHIISGFHFGVNETFDILGLYAAHLLVGENCALLGYHAVTDISGPIGYPKTSVRNHYSLHNKPEAGSSHLLHGGSLQSCVLVVSS